MKLLSGKQRLLLALFLLFGSLWAQKAFDMDAFSDSTKYGWKNYVDRDLYRQDLTHRQNMLQLYELEALSHRESFMKSAVIPGWGQFATKNYTKATVFLSLELGAAMGAVYFYDKANTHYRHYQNATQIDEINSYYGKAQTPHQYSLMLISLGAVVWAYNLYDVIISTNEYNENLFRDIQQRRSASPLQITATGLELRF